MKLIEAKLWLTVMLGNWYEPQRLFVACPKFLGSCSWDCFFNSNDAFENACMEFDEVNLKPTFKILWGIPGFHYHFWTLFIYAATFKFSFFLFLSDFLFSVKKIPKRKKMGRLQFFTIILSPNNCKVPILNMLAIWMRKFHVDVFLYN